MCEWPKQYVECGPACHDVCGEKTCKNYTAGECFEQCACPEGLVQDEEGRCVEPDCQGEFNILFEEPEINGQTAREVIIKFAKCEVIFKIR